jgi:hypothetical protein
MRQANHWVVEPYQPTPATQALAPAVSRISPIVGRRLSLPSHQVRDDEDELADVERLRQVSLIASN